MSNEILDYCNKHHIKCLFLDFFGTIIQRNCTPEEVKILWSKMLASELNYTVDEERLLFLRKKSEQAVISRAEAGEFNYAELCDEIFRRIIDLDDSFKRKYSATEFYRIAHSVEMQAELTSQRYIKKTTDLIDQAYAKGIHINIISDFYLGQEELKIFLSREEVLKKVDHIFVSSDCKTSKHLGGLYEYACKQLGFNATQCVMAGDNLKSDVHNAEAFGIKGFLLNQSEGKRSRGQLESSIEEIAKSNVSGTLGYSNYCFLLYLYIERLYKSLVREGVKDIYFLSREGELLKKLFDLYICKRPNEEIRTHYLYVSRKATYPATLKRLDEERFGLLRKFPQLSIADFLENIGMADIADRLEIEQAELEKPITDFFNSPNFQKLCERKDFQELYEASRINYNSLFKRYCEQEGMQTSRMVAIADVGWNGTMQDNICKALGAINCTGLYIGLMNSAYLSEQSKKIGLIFSENPQDSRDLELWKYDHVFLERILWASHGATDHYEEKENNIVNPVFKEYTSELENYQMMKPVQDEILRKFEKLDDIIRQSYYCAENLYEEFLDIHIHMLFVVNNQQLELQRKMIKGQMQNFGHLVAAGNSIGTTFSKTRILKKAWSNLHLFKNTEIMFRILLNYNKKHAIKLIYRFRYQVLKKRRK